MAKPFLLFDFDGTIADSIHLGQKIANIIAPIYGLKPFTAQDFQRFRSMHVHRILKELKIPLYKIPGALRRALVEYRKHIHDLEPCSGILSMLEQLCAAEIPMALLSSNSSENLNEFLTRHNISCFEWVEGTSGILNKAQRIKKQLRKHKLNPSCVIYIGDETRDIDAARKSKLKVIAVSWGFHTLALLASHDPDYLVSNPQEIVQIAAKLSK